MSTPIRVPESLIDYIERSKEAGETPGHFLERAVQERDAFVKLAKEITHPDLVRAKGAYMALVDMHRTIQEEIARFREDVEGLQHVLRGSEYLSKLGKRKRKGP
jgi:hypothetical protein